MHVASTSIPKAVLSTWPFTGWLVPGGSSHMLVLFILHVVSQTHKTGWFQTLPRLNWGATLLAAY